MPQHSTLVSVIVPCYNYGRFLAQTLENVLAQTYTHWECIIVDDGSTDDTRTVAETFTTKDNRFKYIYQQNQGLSAARNTGISNSTGAYIQLLDADDLLHQEKLAIQAAYLDKHTDADIVYGNAVFFHTDLGRHASPPTPVPGNTYAHLKATGQGQDMVRRICNNNFVEVSAPLFRSKVVDAVGDFVVAYKSFEDWQFWFRAAVAGKRFVYLPQAGTETYIRYGHTSMMTNHKKMNEAGIQLRRYMMRMLPMGLKIYNAYRLNKLLMKRWYLKLRT